jgi:leader peptidase (prepilin peptidase)/N-methyltransferase
MIQTFSEMYPTVFYVLIGCYALLIGSLLNVIIYRIPLMLKAEWALQCQSLDNITAPVTPTLNLFFPRSFCPSCKAQVKAWQNIPVISYLLLRGRCGQCKHPISSRYPFVEIVTALLFMYATMHFGLTVQLGFALFFICILLCLFFIDLDTQLLPDSLTLTLLWAGLLANTLNLFAPLSTAVLSAAGAYLFLWSIIKIFYLITGKIGMGNGDFKLFAAFGAWFGWEQLPLILLLSCLSGSIIGSIYLKINKKTSNTPIPFGPFLCASGIIALFWGSQLMEWYIHVF